MVVTTSLPGSAGTDLNDKPCFVRKSLTRSHAENLLHGPTNRWNLQSASFAGTTTGVLLANSSSVGFTKCVRPANNGKYVTDAIRQPAMMIFRRPILSDSQPNRMKQ